MSLLSPGAATRTTPFTSAKPGSVIRITDRENSFEPFEATVLEMRPEYGPQAIPALFYKAEFNDDANLILATGRYTIEILRSSELLATDADPEGTMTATTKAVPVKAILFRGGVEAATEVIRFCAGLVSMRYQQATEQQPDALVIVKSNGTEEAIYPGGIVVKSDTEAHGETDVSFADKYERLS